MEQGSKRAVILAGGRGTRLHPYTLSLPKPLVPVGDKPILEIVIRQLAAGGFEHLTLAVNHQADVIRAFFGDGSKWNLKIDYSLELVPLGTMAPLRLIPDLPENFLVMNGDILTDLDYRTFFQQHLDDQAILSISAARREQFIDFGVLHVDGKGTLTNFEEKPRSQYLVSMGVYGLARRSLDWIPEGRPFGFDQLVLSLLSSHENVRIREHNGYWLDIGRPEDYEKATSDFRQHGGRFIKD